MKKNQFLFCMLLAAALFTGCQTKSMTQPTTASASEAFSKAGSLPSAGEKVAFLVKEAQGFLDTQQYDDAALVAEHILEHLDSTNAEARRLARKAYEKTMGNMVGN